MAPTLKPRMRRRVLQDGDVVVRRPAADHTTYRPTLDSQDLQQRYDPLAGSGARYSVLQGLNGRRSRHAAG